MAAKKGGLGVSLSPFNIMRVKIEMIKYLNKYN